MRNPEKSHAVEKKLKRYVISHWDMPHLLNCTCYICYCDCRWKTTVFKNGTSAEAPSRVCPWCARRPLLPAAAGRTPRGRGMLQNAAESNLSTGGVAPAAPWPAAIAELPAASAVAAQDVHGGALRHEERHDRRVVVECCAVQRWQVTDASVQAAAVAAQVAADGREVAVERCLGDVVVSARGGMKPKWRCFYSFFFLWSFCFL